MSTNKKGNEPPRSATPTFKNPVTFKECFAAFSKFGDTKSDGTAISLTQSDKWMKQSKVIDGKTITTTDTAIFFKRSKHAKLNLTEYEKFLTDLVTSKQLNIEEVKRQMGACGSPGISSNVSHSSKIASTVERLTDPSKYTGSHKERFDESGKGKGIEGRREMTDQSGDAYNIFDDNESLPEEVEATLNQIIRDPPCRLSFPSGCPFVLLHSTTSTDKPDSPEDTTDNENFMEVQVEVKIEEPEKIKKTVNFGDKKRIMEQKQIKKQVKRVEPIDSDDSYDEDDSLKENDDEYVEEEEDWNNVDQDSDEYYSSS